MYGTLISTDDFANLIGKAVSELVVVDCRFSLADPAWGRREYAKGHIPGAVYAHLDHDLSGQVIPGVTGRHPLPEVEVFLNWVRDIGISNSTQVVAYDQGAGAIAARIWWLLRWVGLDSVAVLDGGWSSWLRAALPTDSAIPSSRRAQFTPAMRDHLMVGIDVVAGVQGNPTKVLIDSREASRYTGLEEPIDPVAGHIPGAVNLPFGENVDVSGKWKDQEALRARFWPLTHDRDPQQVIFYCGSGVTACHNVLAFKHAGLGDAQLYPGSWSEWIADGSRVVDCPGA